jgi:hypothetical protein
MSQFIRLSNRIINVNTIRTVWQNVAKQTYEVEFVTKGHSGLWIFGSGMFSTEDYSVTYNKDKHPEDYAIVDTWYNSFCKGAPAEPQLGKGAPKEP